MLNAFKLIVMQLCTWKHVFVSYLFFISSAPYSFILSYYTLLCAFISKPICATF